MKRGHIYRVFVAFVFAAALTLTMANVSTQAATYKNYGTYAKTIKGTKYYINLSVYTSGDPEEKATGAFYVFKGTKNYNKHKFSVNGEYYKLGKNKYRFKMSGSNSLTIKIKSNKKISVSQKGKIVKGVKLNGTYKLVKRFTP